MWLHLRYWPDADQNLALRERSQGDADGRSKRKETAAETTDAAAGPDVDDSIVPAHSKPVPGSTSTPRAKKQKTAAVADATPKPANSRRKTPKSKSKSKSKAPASDSKQYSKSGKSK